MDNNTVIITEKPINKLTQLTLIIYILYALSVFAGITAIAAIIINYIKREEVQGTFLASHFRWQIRTFWYGVLWCVIGFITMPILVGFIIWAAAAIWLVYRLVKGVLNLNDEKPMYH
ncbi:hypothetical protein L1889_17235 [Paenalcaligenes niemegkensis]|uniref:DUF4870 family protein n=1 Tax=Paenalcaligenes niemegkensis TaxID=2895469 RepID=UPI001EE89461|nr:hypothetical protein [Paenalcaligenes niemegkensis]MCQ9618200.1 hypothetical protein [Paenalcaligenes niemegkensis]